MLYIEGVFFNYCLRFCASFFSFLFILFFGFGFSFVFCCLSAPKQAKYEIQDNTIKIHSIKVHI